MLLINTAESTDLWKQRLKYTGEVVTILVTAQRSERATLPFVGAICTGAAARLIDVISRETLARTIHDEIPRYGEAAVRTTLQHALAAFDAMEAQAGIVREGTRIGAADYRPPGWIELPVEEASVSAPDITAPATSELADTGVWRTHRPVIDYEHCNRRSWVCSTLCPDSVIKVEADQTPRIDYDHCKGCMVCVAVCPPHAIRAVPEKAEWLSRSKP